MSPNNQAHPNYEKNRIRYAGSLIIIKRIKGKPYLSYKKVGKIHEEEKKSL
jgi:lipopolysaccharide biosynthesis protein